MPNDTLIGEIQNTYSHQDLLHPSGDTTTFPYLASSTESSYELDGSLVTSVTTTSEYNDFFGNPTQITVDNGGGYKKITYNTYLNDTGYWILGRVTSSSVSHYHPTQPTIVRESSFTHDPVTGDVLSMTIEPSGTVNERLDTTYGYDGFGNLTSTTVSGGDITTRSSSVSFDTDGRFPVSATNALGHTETRVFDERCRSVESVTGPNLLTTTWEYDEFCREVQSTGADGSYTVSSYSFGSTPYSLTTESFGSASARIAPRRTVYLDELGRTTRTETQQVFGSTLIHQDVEYDYKGRVTRSSRPYNQGDPKYWAEYDYDILGRVTSVTAPDQSVTTTSYNGLVASVTNDKGQMATSTRNIAGQIVSVQNALNDTMSYEYDALGNLVKTIDPNGNQTIISYDLRGRKTAMTDPDMGAWQYQYNSLGELISQTDAKSQTITMQYDKLGRMVQRTTPDGTSTWTYDTALKGIGKLHTVSGPNGYSRSHVYDTLGRPSDTTVSHSGFNFTSTTTYDANGRVDTMSYPGLGLTVQNEYSANGYTEQLRLGVGGTVLWRLGEMNPDGGLKTQFFGSGQVPIYQTFDPETGYLTDVTTGSPAIQSLSFDYDTVGNVLERQDNLQGITETFGYDAMSRLISYGIGGGSTTLSYDSIGNITYKSDVGSYDYTSGRPHAVTYVDSSTASNPGYGNGFAPGGTYGYDSNGNLASAPGRTVTWTSFNKPAQITTAGSTVAYTYGPEFQRLSKVVDGGAKTTLYVGKSYERITEGADVKHRYYVSAGSVTLEVTRRSGQADQFRYLLGDHLGSTDVIADGQGNVLENLSFDPWGLRRNPNWTPATGPIASASTRGFTGHEHDDEVGLVNMNARVYEPVLGRFLSADTIIPSALSSKSYNRYSYLDNNPLNDVDPSGHCRKSCLKGIENREVVNAQQILGRKDLNGPALYKLYAQANPDSAHPICKSYGCYRNSKGIQHFGPTDQNHVSAVPSRNPNAAPIPNLSHILEDHRAQQEAEGRAVIAAAGIDQARWDAAEAHIEVAMEAVRAIEDLSFDIFDFGRTTLMTLGAATGVGGIISTSIAQGGDVGDIALNLGTAYAFSFVGDLNLPAPASIAAHAVVGGASAELAGGNFIDGAVTAGTSKGTTLGLDKFGAGDITNGVVTVGGGAFAAEITGGDPALAAYRAGLGYAYNHMGQWGGWAGSSDNPQPSNEELARATMMMLAPFAMANPFAVSIAINAGNFALDPTPKNLAIMGLSMLPPALPAHSTVSSAYAPANVAGMALDTVTISSIPSVFAGNDRNIFDEVNSP